MVNLLKKQLTANEIRYRTYFPELTEKNFNPMNDVLFKFIFGRGFSLSGSASYIQYLGFTNDYDDSYLLCNLFVGKKVFRNQLGEINIGVNDIFNQNKAFVRTTGSGWTQNSWNSVVGRYYCVQFVYNLRFFGKKGSKNIKDYQGVSDRPSGAVGMGRSTAPGGGFRPPHR